MSRLNLKVTLIFKLGHKKEVLDEYSSTLEIFIVKNVIFLFFSIDIIFITLTKNT